MSDRSIMGAVAPVLIGTMLSAAIGIRVGEHYQGLWDAGHEAMRATTQRAVLDHTLMPLKESAYQAQLAAGTLQVKGPSGALLTLHCGLPKDYVRTCSSPTLTEKISEKNFLTAVRAQANAQIDEEFAGAYVDKIK